jgi:predicted Zn-dependent protease
MTRLQWNLFFAALVILVPGGIAVGWWYYWPTYLLHQAEVAEAAGDHTRAEEILHRLVQQEPRQLRAHSLRAQVLRHLHRPGEAQAALYQAMQLGLPEVDGRREFALCEAAKGFSPNAEANLQEVLKERPDDWEILKALAEAYAAGERWAEADKYYSRWLKAQPDRAEAWMARGRTRLAALGVAHGQAEAAVGDFREALRLEPDNYQARLSLAQALLNDARVPEAKKELLVLQGQRPDRPEPRLGLAACAIEERDWDQAESLLQQVLEREPKSVLAYTLLGDVNLRRERADRAAESFEKALALDPRNRGLHLKLAQALRQSGKAEQAKEHERIYQELANEKQ